MINATTRWAAAALCAFTLQACSEQTQLPTAELPRYTIISDTVKKDIKRTVEVELAQRTDEETLRALAQAILKQSDADVERTFIGYRITGAHKRTGYWASTNFNPELEVKILGATHAEFEAMGNAPDPEGKVLGNWMAHWGNEHKVTVYVAQGQTIMRNTFANGKFSETPVTQEKTPSGLALLDEDSKETGEYFLINDEGELEYWSENGNFYTAPKA